MDLERSVTKSIVIEFQILAGSRLRLKRNLGPWFVLGRLACGTSVYVIFGELGEARH